MSSQMESASPGAIDLSTLPVAQLRALQQRLDTELEHLTQSHTKLRAAQTKFKGCVQSITDGVEAKKNQTTAAEQGDHILIPLTNSLYVKGKIEDREKVIVDVGTGFYVEKTTAKAKEFYEKKVKELDTNIKELDKVLQIKTMNDKVVQNVLRQKILKEGAQSAQKRFNLISKSDIRYVGTLHQINPEDSTIALENVVSHGTEGRRGNPADEIHPTSNVYEYIVFRGSDVKDISMAEEEERPAPLSVPDDPAILGCSSSSTDRYRTFRVGTPQPAAAEAPVTVPPASSRPPIPPGWPQQPAFPGYYPPFNQRFGPPGFAPAPAMPGPYGASSWYPPVPNDGFG
ncbi:subunit of tubulin prefoldin, partial [Ascosphaera aggregata]